MLAKLLALLLHSKSAAVSAVFVLGTTGALVSATTQNGVTTITVTQTTESSSQVTTSDKDNDKDEHSSTKSPPTTTTANAQSCAADAQARNVAVRTVDTTFVQDFTALNTLARTKGEKGKEAAKTADKVLMQLRQDAAKSTIEALPTVAHKDATTRKVEIQRSGTKADKPATKDSERD